MNPRHRKRYIFAACVVATVILVSLARVHWHDPVTPFVGPELSPPSWQFWMGTDALGRDVFSRLVSATWNTLSLSAIAVVGAAVIGTLLGTLAGWNIFPWLTPVILFVGQISVVFPIRWLPLLLVAIFGDGTPGMVISMFFSLWGQFLWLIHDETVNLRGRTFIHAAYAVGGTRWSVIRYHVYPHLLPTISILATLSFRTAIGVISTLSFLGIGLQPPTPTWGLMISEGEANFLQAWWTVLFPTLALAGSVIAANEIGNWLERRWTVARSPQGRPAQAKEAAQHGRTGTPNAAGD